MIALPDSFLARPIAHRALHDHAAGRPENSRAAVRAAVDANYGIEVDVQLSADGQAMVFHDYALERLTGEAGPIRARTAAQLSEITLTGGDDGIPTLPEVLDDVAGQVPLLIEIKDQDGALGPDVGPLEAAVASALQAYDGDAAVMSFNPHAVAAFHAKGTGRPIGLTTDAFDPATWPVAPARLDTLRRIPDANVLPISFISHDRQDLDRPRVTELKGDGIAVLTWTIRSAEEEDAARRIAQNITFEGYKP